MTNRRIIWEVELEVIGEITIDNVIRLRQEKGFDLDQFYSNIKIVNSKHGIRATVTAYAPNSKVAHDAALLYFGKMIDVLSIEISVPLELVFYESQSTKVTHFKTRRIVEKWEFENAFKTSRKLELDHQVLLKAISWYAKGVNATNSLDKFIALWTVIEIIGCKYFTETDRTRGEGKVKNKIYQCFIDYFGEINTWGLPNNWIDDMYDLRNKIVHGGISINIESLENIERKMELIESLSRKLLMLIYMDVIHSR